MFGKMNTKNAESRIFTSGKGGKFTVDSGIYPATIVNLTAYATGNESQIQGVLELALDMGEGQEPRKYLQYLKLVTKEGNNTYTDQKTGDQVLFEDVSIMTELCNITCKAYPEEMETADTMIEITDYETKQKKAVPAETMPELVGKQIEVAILEFEEYKRKQVGKEWVDTDELQVKNKIDAIFQVGSHKTLKELQAGSEEPVAYTTWGEYWSGKVKEAKQPKGKKKATKTSEKSSNVPASAQNFDF